MNKDFKKLIIQKGATLVELVATMGISAVVALVVAKVMESGQKDFKRIEARIAINTVHQSITSIMQDKASCTMTLRDYLPDGTVVPPVGIEISTIKKCRTSSLEDINGDDYPEINCAANALKDSYSTGVGLSNNSIEVDKIIYKDDINPTGAKGPRLEITYNVIGANRNTVSGIKQIKKEPILLGVSYNKSNIFSCEADISNIYNASVEQSCKGNNAYLDTSGEVWKCYHETDLPECPAGSAIVAVIASDQDQNQVSFDSWILGDVFNGVAGSSINDYSKRKNPSQLFIDSTLNNNKAVTFNCVDITPVNESCDDSDNNTLDITLIKGAGDDLVSKFYESECVHVPNCYDATSGNYFSSNFYHLSFDKNAVVIDSIDHKFFKCERKKCSSANEVAITTSDGEQCVSCPPGSVIIKTQTSPGFKCSNTSCIDNKASGTSANTAENVQKYFTGRWDEDGDPVCRDLITTDVDCADGGALKVAADGSVSYECCPSCDASFNAERANVCFGSSFTTSNGCTICEGTKDLQSGCLDPTLYCPGTPMGTSECGENCNPATKPIDEGTLSDWSDWSICHGSPIMSSQPMNLTTTRTRTCDGAECGGSCNGATLEQTEECPIYSSGGGSKISFDDCVKLSGHVVYVNPTTKSACNLTESNLNSYLNSSSPVCVPLCFVPPTNDVLNGRTAGHPDAYTSKGCGETEIIVDKPACPPGLSRFQDFYFAESVTCNCCVARDGCNAGNFSCTDVASPAVNFESKDLSEMFSTGDDKVLTNVGNGNKCNTSTPEEFFCFPKVALVGCH